MKTEKVYFIYNDIELFIKIWNTQLSIRWGYDSIAINKQKRSYFFSNLNTLVPTNCVATADKLLNCLIVWTVKAKTFFFQRQNVSIDIKI